MSEVKKLEEKEVAQVAKKPDYYATNANLRVLDFLVGFIGSLFFLVFCWFVFYYTSQSVVAIFITTFIVPLLMVLMIGLCIYSLKVGRRFIGVGILSVVAIPLLLFGSCLMLLK